MRVGVVAGSWLAAVAGLGSALVLAVTGQGLGAMVGGCDWIGAALPLHRQVWALVNQPVLNFSSLPIAGGYWLGSIVLPLFSAMILLTLRPQKPTLIGQLAVVQAIWWAALVAGTWLPLLDPDDGHLARWLMLHRFPSALVWLAPVISSLVALCAALRLLEIARSNHWNMSRGARIWTLVIHLVLPVGAWLGLVLWVGGRLPICPVLGLLIPVTSILVFAWVRYPPPFPRPLSSPSQSGVIMVLCAAVLAAVMIWWAGWPREEGRTTGLLWGESTEFNNIRPWIEPRFPSPGSTDDLHR